MPGSGFACGRLLYESDVVKDCKMASFSYSNNTFACPLSETLALLNHAAASEMRNSCRLFRVRSPELSGNDLVLDWIVGLAHAYGEENVWD